MNQARKRILFLAEGATMAHFVRPLALAQSLATSEYDICFYAPAAYARYLCGTNFTTGTLETLPNEQFVENLAKGAPMYPLDTLRGYVRQDREIIQRIKPDLVVGDLRLSLPISARLEKTRFALIMNAYWSPYTKKRRILPQIPLTAHIPPRFISPLYKLVAPIVSAIHVGQMNRVRREFNIPTLPLDFGHMYMDGEHVLYPDIPEFVPTVHAPPSHRYIGICEWSLPVPKPDWWQAMLQDPKPKVFISLGSSGPLKAAGALFEALSKLPVSVLLSTSGRQIPEMPGAYITRLLPFTETAHLSHVVVSHGGSGGLYPAMAAGTPVLGIPSNADQHLSTAVLEDSGAGLGVRAEEASPKRLRHALERLLFEPKFRDAARGWQSIYARYDSATLFRAFLKETLR
jgi:UDP:flavonoid glycosyltransferase YjiC (YdhE family)